MLYDISPPITEQLAVWPGDVPYRREVKLDLSAGDEVTLSTLHSTVHLGAHADAFAHIEADGATIEAIELERYIGPCHLLRLETPRGHAIRPADLPESPRAPRVLLATGTYPDPQRFNEDFAALSVELIDMLQAAGVRLVGLDTPSVDLLPDKDLPVHRHLARCGIATLEGLRLDHVPAGIYELIALPLRLVGCDASPVRAVLRTQKPA